MRVTGTTAHFKILKPVFGIPAWEAQGIYSTNDPAVKARLRRLPDDHALEVEQEKEEVAPTLTPIEELNWYELVKLGEEKGVFRNGMKKSELIAALMKPRHEGE